MLDEERAKVPTDARASARPLWEKSAANQNGLDAGQMFSTGQRMGHTWACDVPERVALNEHTWFSVVVSSSTSTDIERWFGMSVCSVRPGGGYQ